MNYYVKKAEELTKKVEELLEETSSEIINVLDSRVQMRKQKDNINRFAAELVKKMSEKETHRESIELVKDSMTNLSKYVSNEPIRLDNIISILEQKRMAFNECKNLCEDAKYSMSQEFLKEKRIEKSIKDGTVNENRTPGSRPEKLRDIRNTMSKIEKESSPTSATERFSEENSYIEHAEIAEENI